MSKAFFQQLAKIQRELNAPKNQRNTFGNYNYRSCEDILEWVKPLLGDLFLSVSDEIVQIGDRFYVKATATITDGEHSHSASAMAREALTKKGMDDAQVTGATSSYARKYCLNGLFGIDDAKDADTDEHRKQEDAAKPVPQKPKLTPQQVLNKFTAAAPTLDIAGLEEAFTWTKAKLAGSKDLLSKATEVYNIQKTDLELPI
ncbi:recombinase [Serratia fonticola]|uniref:ERF family protein n=1 Tax=Serratia fonticola TaxID=47917 RepID=UPI0008FD0C26|nr:ERF family protein [Serratia fonticola]OIX96261.1 recombinase [Serratia fonticola]QCR60817.1 recombinase [Serratia fonticola]